MPPSEFEPIHISVLSTSHNVDEFDCGDQTRNSWLKARALSNQASDDSRTYVAALSSGTVVGFYAITTGAIVRGVLPGSMRRNAPDPVSAVLLAQLGVDTAYQGQGIGCDLVLHAMGQTVKVAEIAGCRLLIVHPATSELASYYKNFGFTEIDAAPASVMAMSLQKVRATLDRLRQAAIAPTSS